MANNTISILPVIHHLIPINHELEYVHIKFSHCFTIRSPLVTIGSHSLPFNIQWKTFPTVTVKKEVSHCLQNVFYIYIDYK